MSPKGGQNTTGLYCLSFMLVKSIYLSFRSRAAWGLQHKDLLHAGAVIAMTLLKQLLPMTLLARTVYIHTVLYRIFGDFPAKNTVYTTCIYIYGSGKT